MSRYLVYILRLSCCPRRGHRELLLRALYAQWLPLRRVATFQDPGPELATAKARAQGHVWADTGLLAGKPGYGASQDMARPEQNGAAGAGRSWGWQTGWCSRVYAKSEQVYAQSEHEECGRACHDLGWSGVYGGHVRACGVWQEDQ